MIDKKTITILEFDKILQIISNYCYGQSVREKLLQLNSISYSLDDSMRLLQLTSIADKVLYEYSTNPISEFLPCGIILQKASKDVILSVQEILQIGNLLRSFRIASSSIQNIEDDNIAILKSMTSKIHTNKKLEDSIFSSIINADEISDRASSNLFQIRNNIKNCNQEIANKLSEMIKSKEIKKYLQDSIITLRNGRYVLPVKNDSKQFVSGFVHDKSASNLTVFVEPTCILELNNKLRSLQIDEDYEIQEILRKFSMQIKDMCEQIQNSYLILEELDEIFAKARYSRIIKGICPEINSSGIVDLVGARHPLIDPEKVVPIDISIGDKYDVLILTGPNTGGKTVSIKTVGLMCLMAMCGIFIPCRAASRICIFERVFCDIGDKQSIEENLSTFSSHITNIKNICDKINNSSLVLLDEIGGGTDPEEGAALAIAIIEYIKSKGGKLITTTHYGTLKRYCHMEKRAENASMEFNGETLTPTYKLQLGHYGNSKAFEIATMLGLNANIVENAKNYLSQEKRYENEVTAKVDEIVSRNSAIAAKLEIQAKELEDDKRATLQIKDEYEKKLENIKQNANQKTKQLIRERLIEVERLVREIKSSMEKTRFTTSDIVKSGEMKKRIETLSHEIDSLDSGGEIDTAPFIPEKAKVGDDVYIKSLNSFGKIVSINYAKKQATISMGLMTANVKFKDILFAEKPIMATTGLCAIKNDFKVKAIKAEINILGQNTYEAEQNVEMFLDEAIFSGLKELKIIHGRGTGKLKNCVWNVLKTHNRVDSYRLGNYGEGDTGVTIVILK